MKTKIILIISIIAFVSFVSLLIYLTIALTVNTYPDKLYEEEYAKGVNVVWDDDTDKYEVMLGQEKYIIKAEDLIVRYDIQTDHSYYVIDVMKYKSKWLNKERQEITLCLVMRVENGVKY